MCFFCFSSKPLSPQEKRGRLAAFADKHQTFDISMCEVPCSEPCCCLGTMLCYCPAQILMRHRALNHVHPGSGWSNYKCCQGYFGGCLCLQPGHLCEENCPVPCMCLESCICPGLAVSATSFVIRQEYQLGLDADDIRMIRCNNCLQIFSCVFTIFAYCTECQCDDQAARMIDCIADAFFCAMSGCMTAQVYHEIKLRERMTAPKRERMDRF